MKRFALALPVSILLTACGGNSSEQVEGVVTSEFAGRVGFSSGIPQLTDCSGKSIKLGTATMPEQLLAVLDKAQSDPGKVIWLVVKGTEQSDESGMMNLQVTELVSSDDAAPCVLVLPGSYLVKEGAPDLISKMGLSEDGSFQLVIVDQTTGAREDIMGNWRVSGTMLELLWKDEKIAATVGDDGGVTFKLPGRELELVYYRQ